jgi:hypothetical protein
MEVMGLEAAVVKVKAEEGWVEVVVMAGLLQMQTQVVTLHFMSLKLCTQ